MDNTLRVKREARLDKIKFIVPALYDQNLEDKKTTFNVITVVAVKYVLKIKTNFGHKILCTKLYF